MAAITSKDRATQRRKVAAIAIVEPSARTILNPEFLREGQRRIRTRLEAVPLGESMRKGADASPRKRL